MPDYGPYDAPEEPKGSLCADGDCYEVAVHPNDPESLCSKHLQRKGDVLELMAHAKDIKSGHTRSYVQTAQKMAELVQRLFPK